MGIFLAVFDKKTDKNSVFERIAWKFLDRTRYSKGIFFLYFHYDFSRKKNKIWKILAMTHLKARWILKKFHVALFLTLDVGHCNNFLKYPYYFHKLRTAYFKKKN